MDNGAPPSQKGSARAVTKPRPSDPVDPRTEQVPATTPVEERNGIDVRADGGSTEPVSESPGQRLKRRLAASGLLRPREPAIVAPDADDEVVYGTGAPAGPLLLPPIRTGEGDGGNGAADTAKAEPNGGAAAPVAVGELVARKLTAPPEVVAPDVPSVIAPDVPPAVAPPLGPLDVPLEQPVTEQAPRLGRPSITFQRRRTRPRVRRVTRVVRHIDTWSVFKVALVFSVFIYAVALTAGVLLWHVAIATGTVDNVERFFEGFGWRTFKFKGGEIYHNAWIAGLFGAIGLTGLAVLVATMFNLITDLVGGIRVSVLEEEVLARRDRTAKVVVEGDPEATMPYDQARFG